MASIGEAADLGTIVRLLKQRQTAPAPVPVSERPWERSDWSLYPDGECWWCPPYDPAYWQTVNPAIVYGGWLLPAHALPVPSGEVES